uniref:G1/S-specific cyclin CCN1 n=1 Tax=Tolypocladium ophioglossoides (strain CBS 100239) TaxID=1163406 RepID=A0A0L0NAZ9_TOLOC
MEFTHADETFYVESDDPRQQCIDPRAAAKMVARQRQDVIAGELSRLAADEYLEDILKHMQTMEACFPRFSSHASLIDMQREIQWYMRPYLVVFLVEAHAAFVLLPETLFLTVNLLDRYCSKRVVYKHHYQLVGCAALLIAAKYGDKKDRVPQISELSNMCCGLYDAGMFTQMEMHVLNTLEWTIGHPTVDFFSQLLVAYEHDDKEVDCMASYLCEIALYHRDFVSIKPSTMARASLAVARAVLGRPEVADRELDHEEGTVAETIAQHLDQPSPTLARKYSSPNTYRVSHRLAEFAAARAAAMVQIQRNANPPSPPAEITSKHGDLYSTPQKGHVAPNVFDGYLTPPITPDGACFGNMPKDSYPLPPRCPVTPTPQQHHASGYAQHARHKGVPNQQRLHQQ